MKTSIPSATTSNQIIKILTDVEVVDSSIQCSFTATVSPAVPFLSVSADSKTLILDASKM